MLRPLEQAILKQGGQAYWFLAGKEINPEYLYPDENRLQSIEEVVDWQPDAVLVPGNFVPSFLPGIKVGLFHGFNVAKSTRSDSRGHFNIRGCFDLYCTQGPATTKPFEKLAKQYQTFKVTETGWPALDPLFKPVNQKSENQNPTLLYCSTFTPELSSAPHLLETIRELSQRKDYKWLVQFHPKMDKQLVEAYKAIQNQNLTFIETDDVIPLLKKADVMICDTSSMIPMFLVQQKPVVTFKNQTRGPTPYLIDTQQPQELEEAIKKALNPSKNLLEEIRAYTDSIHPYHDGRSADRVLQAIDSFVEKKESDYLKKKPLNFIRNLKERKKLGYWAF